ncbi:MAG TPA: SIMPL domain-containing protein [Thermoleophilaceae bacterium]
MLAGRTRIHLAAAAVAILGAIAAPASAVAQSSAEPRSIVVVGTAVAQAPNDTAALDFRVEARSRTASGALANNAVRLQRVIDAIVGLGVARADVQTSNVSLRRYVRRVGKRRRKVTRGYLAVNAVSVTVRRIDTAGAVVDAAVRAGATGVSGVDFSTSKRDELYRQALADAYSDARSKAERLAQQSGVALGAPHTIVEGFEELGFDDEGRSQAGFSAPEGTVTTPIEPGTATIEATVTVRFAIS